MAIVITIKLKKAVLPNLVIPSTKALVDGQWVTFTSLLSQNSYHLEIYFEVFC